MSAHNIFCSCNNVDLMLFYSVDPDNPASYSGSTLFSKEDIKIQQDKGIVR